jgi:osmotically-inducible protein OsmY
MRVLAAITGVAISVLCALALTGCPGGGTNPDTEKKVQEKMAVPGLAEDLKAKDEAVKAAVMMSWKMDPELAQEQLAITDVHDGKMRITGIVSRKELKDRAESIAKNQEGVVDVVSTITVDESLKSKRINLDDM